MQLKYGFNFIVNNLPYVSFENVKISSPTGDVGSSLLSKTHVNVEVVDKPVIPATVTVRTDFCWLFDSVLSEVMT